MKYCYICKETKPYSEFSKDKSKSDGYQSKCRSCDNKRLLIRRKEDRDWLSQYKTKCIKCGENHPSCLDFHHRDPSKKEYRLGDDIGRVSRKKILEEISKCDVLCANCHRKLHWKEIMAL